MRERKYIVPQSHAISLRDRERLNNHKGLVLWFTGLSGSGKSTLASSLEQKLHEAGIRTFLLDGDNVRSGLNDDLGFDSASRDENIRRIAHVSSLMMDAGLVTLCAFVSPFRRNRELVRSTCLGKFVEIYVSAPLEVCEKRDVKGLYAKAREGLITNFTGISDPFEEPEKSRPACSYPRNESHRSH